MKYILGHGIGHSLEFRFELLFSLVIPVDFELANVKFQVDYSQSDTVLLLIHTDMYVIISVVD